ncbi:MAG: hypothetical protein CMH83_23320 [Nocardioides sp.]|nr:hypothetical protein [Nocardioides sp.]
MTRMPQSYKASLRTDVRRPASERLEPRLAAALEGLTGHTWVSGNLGLSDLKLTFFPARSGNGSTAISLPLELVEEVEVAGGRLGRVLGVHACGYVVWVRVLNARTVAEDVAQRATDRRARTAGVR